jgi:pyruvate-ferredoxin/flavodoxin oxidoreductase
MMGSGAETAHETVEALTKGEKIGMLKVRLYRPFSAEHFLDALPATVKALAVLDRTKEPGAPANPSTKTSSPCSAKRRPLAICPSPRCRRSSAAATAFPPRNSPPPWSRPSSTKSPRIPEEPLHGRHQRRRHPHLPQVDSSFSTEDPKVVRALFYGLGADGTVGANKNSVKIIAEETDNYAQGYFVYDSKKVRRHHGQPPALRPEPDPQHLPDLPRELHRLPPVLFPRKARHAALGRGRRHLPAQRPLRGRRGLEPPAAQGAGSDHRQEAEVLHDRRLHRRQGHRHGHPHQHRDADLLLRHQRRVAPRRGHRPDQEGHRKNLRPPRRSRGPQELRGRRRHARPPQGSSRPRHGGRTMQMRPSVPAQAPEFVRDVLGAIIAGDGDSVAVSALPVDGTFPTGTALWEKRNIALEIPVWDEVLCIQCGKCVLVCPHATIRAKIFDRDHLEARPPPSRASRPAGKTTNTWPTPCRWRPRTAPAAPSASRPAR